MGKVKAMMMDREERALDRGSADAYYGRSGRPHIWLDGLGQQVVEKSRMTQGEIAAYWEGYDNQIDRKDWGDDYDDSVL
jgi:hypothetical protein